VDLATAGGQRQQMALQQCGHVVEGRQQASERCWEANSAVFHTSTCCNLTGRPHDAV
jgi:hypothetical protein